MTTYKIVRFFTDDRPSQVIRTGLSLKEARAHCARVESNGDGWFEGYTKEEGG